MRFREHRGGLAESLATTVELPNRAAMVEHIRQLMAPWEVEVSDELLHVLDYGKDPRIDWEPHSLVVLDNYGVVGYVEMQPHFSCPACGAVSYNCNDIAEGWCDRCKRQTAPRNGSPEASRNTNRG